MAASPPPPAPDSSPVPAPGRFRPLWMALAILDTAILAFVAASVPWGLEASSGGSSPLGDVIKWVAIAVTLAAKAFTAGPLLGGGSAVRRGPPGPGEPPRAAPAP